MTSDIIAVIAFVVVILIVCKIWSSRVTKTYDLNEQKTLGFVFECFTGKTKEATLLIVGTGTDTNGDYTAPEAIKEIELSKETRIKLR